MEVVETSRTLLPKQKSFVDQFLIDLNATHAAIRAGYSKKSAKVIGHRLVRTPQIAAAIQEAMEHRAERTGITADKVLKELAACGFSNMADYMKTTKDGDPYLDFSALSREQAAALSEVTVEDYVEGRGDDARAVKKVRFKLNDKLSALEKIGRHIGMFDREKESGQTFNINQAVIQMMERAASPEKPVAIESE